MFTQFYENLAKPQREQSWFFIVGSYFLDVVLVIFLIFVVYARGWLTSIDIATNGVINTTLVANVVLFLIIIVLLVGIQGKEKLGKLGLNLNKFPVGMLAFYGVYILINLILLVLNVAVQNPTIWYPYWTYPSSYGVTFEIGNLLAQIFGNVLLEETFFRGFLWLQLSIKFTKLFGENPIKGLISGAVITNLMFSLLHIPNLLRSGATAGNIVATIALLFGIGMLFTTVYFVTENLYITMAVHVLYNISFALFFPVFPTYLLVIFITTTGLILWTILKVKSLKKSIN